MAGAIIQTNLQEPEEDLSLDILVPDYSQQVLIIKYNPLKKNQSQIGQATDTFVRFFHLLPVHSSCTEMPKLLYGCCRRLIEVFNCFAIPTMHILLA